MSASATAALLPADDILRADFDLYCRNLVHIQGKTGEVVPFVWNAAQRMLHAKLERQLDSRGLVRAIILKARRLGISTYVGARYYHRSTMWAGRNAFILTHEDKSTQELFDLVKRIHENMASDWQPPTQAANANELAFAGMNGGYRVGTAKNVHGTGRGLTLQLFHGSEAAFWPQADKHFAGVIKAVSLVPGTEIILESTANGVGGSFYEQWGLAEKGQSDFIPIFLPWYIDPDNARELPSDYEPSQEELEYQRLYKLSDGQLCWAHFENINLGGQPGKFCSAFRQECPATAAEAFQSSSGNSLIGDEYILAARRFQAGDQSFLPRVLGVDVARSLKDVQDKNGKVLRRDATRLVDRQGRKMGIEINEAQWSDDPVFLAARVMKHLQEHPDIRKAFVDVTEGMGAAIHSIVRSNGFEARVVGVNFGSQAQDPVLYPNRRCEMWARQRDWLKDPGGAQIPDDDVAHRHLAAPGFKHDANSRLVLEPKDKIKSRLGFSPDWGDAGALTFSELLPIEMPDDRPKWMIDLQEEAVGDFMTS